MKGGSPMRDEWPDNWESLILDGNMIIVVGTMKSGLTNLCNLIASFENTYYIYGNTLLKAIPPGEKNLHRVARSAFLYDYVIPNVRGIRGCEIPCAIEDRLTWARSTEERLNKLKLNLTSVDVLYYAAKTKACYLTDIIDGCVRAEEYSEMFPDSRIMHIVRNGFDVITARMVLNLDTDYSYKYPCGPNIDWMRDGKPWYAEDIWDDGWNNATKIAHLWRVQVNSLRPSVFYEKLMGNPNEWAGILLSLSPILKKTPATETVIGKMRGVYLSKMKPIVSISDIQSPEKIPFRETMERLGYL